MHTDHITPTTFVPAGTRRRTVDELHTLASEIRRRTLAACLAAGTGHVGGCSGAVELLTALYFGGVLRHDPGDPRTPGRDRVCLRGHLAPLRYAVFSLLGWVHEDELGRYATLGSPLQGHETADLPGVDFAPTGSLGMVLSYGLGSAIVSAGRPDPWRTFVFLGDGEEQEGNVAEAARHAVAADARHLVAVIDANGAQLSGPVSHADRADLAATWSAYGWTVLDLPDGNDPHAAAAALGEAARRSADGPVVIVARTAKGYGIPGAGTHFSGYHELAHTDPDTVRAAIGAASWVAPVTRGPMTLAEEAPDRHPRGSVPVPLDGPWPDSPDGFQLEYLTRLARTAAAGGAGRLYFLFADTFPEPLLERTGLARAAYCANVGVREQHLVALAHGIAMSDPHAQIIAHTGDAFVLRAADQLAAAAGAGSRFVLIGDDAGLTNSRNGASHQSSHQPLFLAGLPGLHLLEPADAVDFAAAMNHALGVGGVHYVRLHDGTLAAPVPTPPDQRDLGAYVARDAGPGGPDVVLVASGFLVGEALAAATLLAADAIAATVLNVVGPAAGGPALDAAVRGCAPIVSAYDGHPEVLAATIRRAARAAEHVPQLVAKGFTRGRSGLRDDLLAWLSLDAASLAAAAREALR